MTNSVNFACHRGPDLDFCYRCVARQRTGENPPIPANHPQTVAVTLRLFRSIVTAPLCHLSSRGSGVNQLSQFSCHPFSLHPARKHTQITALPTVPPPHIHTHTHTRSRLITHDPISACVWGVLRYSLCLYLWG